MLLKKTCQICFIGLSVAGQGLAEPAALQENISSIQATTVKNSNFSLFLTKNKPGEWKLKASTPSEALAGDLTQNGEGVIFLGLCNNTPLMLKTYKSHNNLEVIDVHTQAVYTFTPKQLEDLKLGVLPLTTFIEYPTAVILVATAVAVAAPPIRET